MESWQSLELFLLVFNSIVFVLYFDVLQTIQQRRFYSHWSMPLVWVPLQVLLFCVVQCGVGSFGTISMLHDAIVDFHVSDDNHKRAWLILYQMELTCHPSIDPMCIQNLFGIDVQKWMLHVSLIFYGQTFNWFETFPNNKWLLQVNINVWVQENDPNKDFWWHVVNTKKIFLLSLINFVSLQPCCCVFVLACQFQAVKIDLTKSNSRM